jgi:hypothetical protein
MESDIYLPTGLTLYIREGQVINITYLRAFLQMIASNITISVLGLT